ncbi:MAG: trehalase family glycosidase [Eubacteriales bacterium]|nr:trehalase family glycosidase [Eubacteriales bacterium]MDD4474572.1 trehalase family glycosidase [Eubacteriales bacterium]
MKFYKAICVVISAAILSMSMPAFADNASETTSKEEIKLSRPEFYQGIVNSEVKFIKNIAMGNGAIPKHTPAVTNKFNDKDLPDINGIPDEVYKTWRFGHVVPYFSQSSIMGAMKAAPKQSKELVANFITWYLDSLNTAETDAYGVDGTIYDFYMFQNPTNPQEVVQIPARTVHADEFANQKDNNKDYDSTDSYAALLIRILYEYYKTYNDTEVFINRKADVDRVMNALFSTYIDELDLTYAKPSYEVCFLMDNCEVYNGLIAAKALYKEVFNENEKAEEYGAYAEKVKNAIEKLMWNEEKQIYYSGIFTNGKPTTNLDLSAFYPNATAQLFPIMFDLIDPNGERAKAIYEKFNENFGVSGKAGHNWAILDKGDDYPWVTIAHVASKVGDYERVDTFMTMLKRKHLVTHEHPYYCGEAGQTLLTTNIMLTPKAIVSLENENITADVGEEIDIGISLYPSTASINKLKINIKDEKIAQLDPTTGLVVAQAAGQTVITISLPDSVPDAEEYMVVLNVTGEVESNIESSTSSSGNNNPGLIAAGIIGTIAVIGGAIALGIYLTKKKKES